jgi:hypothetical protein
MEFTNVTIFIMSTIYGVSSVFCKTLRVEHAPYAQYKKATSLRWRAPRQRKDRGVVLSYDQTMAIVEGKVDKFDNFGPAKSDGSCATSEGKFSACSGNWNNALFSHAERAGKVVYAQNKQGEQVA